MKRKIYFSILLLAALSCSRETLIDDTYSEIPEGERLSFVADLDNTVKSHFADDGTTLEWDTTDRVYVSSAHAEDGEGNALVGAGKWGSSVTEIMSVKIDGTYPTKATFLSGKNRSAWVDAGDGKYSFYAIYPASAYNPEHTPFIDDSDLLWVPVTVPYSQDGTHFGKYHVCVDFAGTAYSKETILDNTATVRFNAFQPKTALLNFNATSAAGNVSIEHINISASWADGESHGSFAPQLSGTAVVSETGIINPGWEYGGNSSVDIYLDTPITIGTSAGDRILAAIIPASSTVKLDFTAFDADGNPRLEGSMTSPAEGFLPGKKYTFTLAMTEAETTVLALECERNFPPEGGAYTGSVISYKYENGTRVAVDWDGAFYSDAACTDPVDITAFDNWFHINFDSMQQPQVGVTTFSYGVNANANIQVISEPSDETLGIRASLQSATPRGTATAPWNLATSDGTVDDFSKFNSANCYIINNPGHYLLPCVAGNGVKNGNFNYSAFTPLAGYESDRDPLFVDYLGNQIVSPIIGYTSSTSKSPYAAFLLWEDVDGLITTSSENAPGLPAGASTELAAYLDAVSPYALQLVSYEVANQTMWAIQFEIQSDKIDQGNAVIAVVDEDGQIMWSWHIWTTDYNPYLTQNVLPVTSYWSNGDYAFMKRNLGWVMVGTVDKISYGSNYVYAKVWQAEVDEETGNKVKIEGGKEITVQLVQEGMHLYNADIQHGYGPYWQAGRKDPMTPGLRGNDGYMHDVTIYGAVKALTGKNFIAENNPAATIADGIRNPYKYYYNLTSSSDGVLSGNGGWFTDNVTAQYGYLWNNVTGAEITGGEISAIISAHEPTVKTIYDPNPAGFSMPPMDAGGTFFAFFVGGKYEDYLASLADEELKSKYVSLLVSASEYGALFYASVAKDPSLVGFLPQVGRRYFYLGGEFQTSEYLDIGGSGSIGEYINEMANVPNCGGYYSNFVSQAFSPVMLCSYPNMYFGFLTLSSSALPVRSVVE